MDQTVRKNTNNKIMNEGNIFFTGINSLGQWRIGKYKPNDRALVIVDLKLFYGA